MAIKKIAFNIQVNRAYPPADTVGDLKTLLGVNGDTGELDTFIKVFDFDYDPAETYFLALQLNAAGTALVNPEAGKTVDQQRTAVEQRDEAASTKILKENKIGEIKSNTAAAVKKLKWKENKARDTDALAGNTNALRAYYQEREDIRQAGNAKETQLEALTTFGDVESFDTREFTNAFIDW